MTAASPESVVEDATLAWLEALRWSVKHRPDIAPGELAAPANDGWREDAFVAQPIE